MRDTGKSNDSSLRAVESVPVSLYNGPVDLGYPLRGAQQGIAQGVVLEGGHVYELG